MAKTFSKTKLTLVTLALLSQPILAQDFDWGSFQSGVSDGGSSGNSSGSSSTSEVSSDSGRTNTSSTQVSTCGITKDNQASLPLYMLNKLSSGKGFFKMSLDPATDRVSIQSDVMVANCNFMLEPKTSKTKEAPYVHYLSVGIKGGKTVKDFEACLAEKVMVEKDGKKVVDPSKVERGTLALNYSFDNSGEFKFLSEGPIALDKGGVYGAIDYKGCDAVEPIAKDGFTLKTIADRDKEQRSKYVAGLCQATSYKDISDELITKYQDYKSILENIRNKLLLEEVKDLSKAIQTGDDLAGLKFEIIGDFQKYVIDPLTEEIRLTYQELKGAQGDAKKALEKKLKELKTKLGTYKKTPYLTEADFNKLKAKGQFDAAEELFALRTTIVEFEKVANLEEGNKRVTPEVAKIRTKNAINQNKVVMKEDRLKYQLKHGEVTGLSAKYARDAKILNKNIEIRTRNYQASMQKMIQRGYKRCQMSFNQRNCMNKIARKIQAMQVTLARVNEANQAQADKLLTKSQEYALLEQEGREYRRQQDDEGTSADGDDVYSEVAFTDDLNPSIDDEMDFSEYSDGGNSNGGQGFNFNQNLSQFQFQGNGQNQNVYNDPNRNPAYYSGASNYNNGYSNNNYNTGYNSPFAMNLNFGAGTGTGYGNYGSSPYGQYYQQPTYGQPQPGGGGFNFGNFGNTWQ